MVPVKPLVWLVPAPADCRTVPKSESFHVSPTRSMLPGFRSRCTSFCWCRNASADAISCVRDRLLDRQQRILEPRFQAFLRDFHDEVEELSLAERDASRVKAPQQMRMLERRSGDELAQLPLERFGLRFDQLDRDVPHEAPFHHVIRQKYAAETAHSDELRQSETVLDGLALELAPQRGYHGIFIIDGSSWAFHRRIPLTGA